MPKKRYPLFLSLIVISALLMTFQSRKGALAPLRFLTFPLMLSGTSTASVCSSIKGTFRKYTLREEELDGLRAEMLSLKLREQYLREAVLENRRLRDVLCLKERQYGFVAAARVIGRGGNRWSNAFVIDKGRTDSIAKDMVAITVDGLVGKVQEVHRASATVLPLDDMLFRASVRLQDSRAEAVLSGSGAGRCKLKYVNAETRINAGEAVITSGLDGIFPPGIIVGFVSWVSPEAKGFFHEIEVTPFVTPGKIEEVIIAKR